MHKKERKRKIRGGGAVGKAIVHGLLERGGQVRATVIGNTGAIALQRQVYANVELGSHVYTDDAAGYKGISEDYVHKVVDHAKRYVEGRVHTNGLENFWSLLKRGLKGTYVAVDPQHLGRYLDEQVFRFNKRKGTDQTRFLEVMLDVLGKRLTYKELIGEQA